MSNAPNLPPDQLLELLLTLKKTTPTAARTILNGQPAIAYGLISLMVQMNAIDIDVFQKTLAGYQGSAPAARPASAPIVPPAAAQPPPPHMGPPPSHLHSHSSTPVPAIPPHMQQGYQGQYRTSTPPGPSPPHSVSQTPPFAAAAVPPPAAYGGYPASNGYSGGGGAPPASGPPPSSYGAPPPGLSGGPPGGGGYPPGLSSQGPPYGGYGPPSGRGYGNGPPPHMQQHPPPAPAIPGLSPELTATLAALGDEQKALIMRVISMSPEQIRALPPQERSTYVQIRATFGIATPGG